MSDIRYTRDHEWVRLEGGVATVGITGHAQEALGNVTFVELPQPGREVQAGEACAVVESVKVVSDVYAPVSGRITEANAAVVDQPALVNSAAAGAGWFFRMELTDRAGFDALMDEATYSSFVETL